MHKRKPIKMIKAQEIKDHYSIYEAIKDMEEAFKILSGGKSTMPKRYVTHLENDDLTILLKPAAVHSDKRASIKILTQKVSRIMEGIPTIVGIILIIDTYTGEIVSIMDGEYITALRTGAASGLATQYLSPEDANTVAIFGCGAQGKTQLEAVNSVRNINKVWIYDVKEAAAQSFILEMQPKIDAHIEYTEDLIHLKTCDIICTATNSEKPLFGLKHIKEGVHINAIGSFKPNMQEIDPYLLAQASVFVDDQKSCLAESGDLIKAFHGGIFQPSHIKGEIGNVALSKIKGRTRKNEITVFKSVGVAIQDYVVASEIYEKSKKESFGTEIRLFD